MYRNTITSLKALLLLAPESVKIVQAGDAGYFSKDIRFEVHSFMPSRKRA